MTEEYIIQKQICLLSSLFKRCKSKKELEDLKKYAIKESEEV